jgi:hypothetical protein
MSANTYRILKQRLYKLPWIEQKNSLQMLFLAGKMLHYSLSPRTFRHSHNRSCHFCCIIEDSWVWVVLGLVAVGRKEGTQPTQCLKRLFGISCFLSGLRMILSSTHSSPPPGGGGGAEATCKYMQCRGDAEM